jgi:hypothetical protein
VTPLQVTPLQVTPLQVTLLQVTPLQVTLLQVTLLLVMLLQVMLEPMLELMLPQLSQKLLPKKFQEDLWDNKVYQEESMLYQTVTGFIITKREQISLLILQCILKLLKKILKP